MPVAMEKGAETYYLTYDQVGSLRAVADSSGSVVKRIDYDSFGSVINDTNPAFAVSFGFAGGLHDRDTDLVRFGFRDYDPDVGRWTAKDPILFAGGDVDLYGYCLNDPINWVDPDGLILPGPTGALGGAIVGGISGAITGAIVAGKEVGWKGAVLGAVGGGVAGVASGFVGGLVTGTLKGGIIGGVAGNLVGALIGEMLSPVSISEYERTHMIRKSIPRRWQIQKPIPRPNAPC
jgi:RHS repeat-associated protein